MELDILGMDARRNKELGLTELEYTRSLATEGLIDSPK